MRDRAWIARLALGICVALISSVVGCREGDRPQNAGTPSGPTPTPSPSPHRPDFTPSPTPSPSPQPPGFTPSPCCRALEYPPPVCGIVPGQSTTQDVRQVLGPPPSVYAMGSSRRRPPDGRNVDTLWAYPYECRVDVYFRNDTVAAVKFRARYWVPLGELVASMGPPDKVYIGAVVDSDWVQWFPLEFIWAAEGIAGVPSETPPVEQLDAIPPFPAGLRFQVFWYFPPADLETLASTYHSEYLFDWPGMTE
jgi:hypothetical protein